MLKSLGYLVSSVSVLLLGIVSVQATIERPEMIWPLIAGMAASILGMLLRWLSFLQERREKRSG